MSDTAKRPFTEALTIAQKIVAGIADTCTEVVIAGSIRRRKAVIGDIEIVAIPKGDQLYQLLDEKLEAGTIRHITPRKRWGQRQRSFMLGSWMVEIWIQPDPATFPVNLMIRTGSALFSKRMVTPKSAGGFMPDWYKIDGSRVICDGQPIAIEDEPQIFEMWGIDFVEPIDRTDIYRPTQFKPVRPHISNLFDSPADNLPIPAPVAMSRQPSQPGAHSPTPVQAERHPTWFRFDDPLPERFRHLSFEVSPDAGTPAARERRAAEVRDLYA